MAAHVQTPRMGSEITLPWLEFMLTTYEARNDPGASVEVIEYEVRAGTKPGDNVASEIVKIAVNGLKHRTDTTSSPTKYALVAKFNPGNEFDLEFVKFTKTHLNELLVYSDVMRDFNEFQERVAGGKYRIDVPEFVYGVCTEDEYVLVMQDVSADGYTTQDKLKGLDLPYVLMAADRLARMHAVSLAFEKTYGFLDKYPSFAIPDSLVPLFANFHFMFYDSALEAAKIYAKNDALVEKMEANREMLKEKYIEILKSNDSKNRVLCLGHADYWTNNLMFHHEKVEECQNGEDCEKTGKDEVKPESHDGINEKKGDSQTGENEGISASKEESCKGENGGVKESLGNGRDEDRRGEDSRKGKLRDESKTTSQTKPDDLMLIDWALLYWRNPILDLQHLVYSSTTLEFRRAHLKEIIETYHKTFTTATRDLEAEVPNYELEDLMKEWRRTSVYGLINAGIFANSVVLCEATKECFKKGSLSSGFKSTVIKAISKFLIPWIMTETAGKFMANGMKKKFTPMFEELKSGKNHVLTGRVLDILNEGFELGLFDQ